MRGFVSGETNSLFNIINQELDINIIHLHAKDPYEVKYQFLVNKIKSAGLKHFNDTKSFTEYSSDIDDIYKSIEEYNLSKKRKVL